MNLEKFRHKNPANEGYINESVVMSNFSRAKRERTTETIDGQIIGMFLESSNESAYITVPACARKSDR